MDDELSVNEFCVLLLETNVDRPYKLKWTPRNWYCEAKKAQSGLFYYPSFFIESTYITMDHPSMFGDFPEYIMGLEDKEWSLWDIVILVKSLSDSEIPKPSTNG